jgi:alkylation response protein AidB-like acyl-CoA dehydrogenase
MRGQTGIVQPINLTDEQRQFRAVVRQFAEDKLAPLAAETDERAEFSWPAFEALRAMELTSVAFPEQYGGGGADVVTQAIVVEELSRVDAAASLMFLISKLAMMPVLNFGSDDLKARYAPKVASGESQASYCLSEADAGSDVAAMSSRAVRDGDTYVLNGGKAWITNGGISDFYTVFAKTDPASGHRGISAFVVEKDWGVQVSKLEHKLGVRGSPTAQLVFDDVRVPAENLIGEEGRGFYYAMHTLDRSRPTIGAQAVGIAQGALDCAVGYMKERRTFGRPISENQGLQWMVADAAMKIEAARGLVYRACALVDDDDPDGDLSMFGAMAKCFASDVAMQVTTDAVQLLGGYGYTTDFPVERMMRDAKITQIYEGTNQIQRMVIARHLFN